VFAGASGSGLGFDGLGEASVPARVRRRMMGRSIIGG